jgi:DNA polymerase III subunit epsilon
VRWLTLLLAALGVALAAAGAWWLSRRWRTPRGHVALRTLEFVAIDLETTGLDPGRDTIVALAAIPFVGGQAWPEAGYTCVVNPGRPIPPEAQAVHGISDADVRDAPPAATALTPFLAACAGRTIVAHTAGFDLAIINRLARRPVLDIGVLAHAVFPSWWDLSLEGLSRLVEVAPIDRHTARGDALTAGLILLRMIPLLEQRGVTTLADALRLQRRGPLLPGGPGATGGGLTGP